VVKHQEAGIDAIGFSFQRHINGMRVSAKITVCLKQADFVVCAG
jgi:hypothetical protein